jgi:hypothetical protein
VEGKLIDGKLIVDHAMIGHYTYWEFNWRLKGPQVTFDITLFVRIAMAGLTAVAVWMNLQS